MAQVTGSDGTASGLGPPAEPYGVWGDAGPAGLALAEKPPPYGIGVIGTSQGVGVQGLTKAGSGVTGTATGNGIGVTGTATGNGIGVSASSDTGPGLSATSQQGQAIVATSTAADAINGTTSSQAHAGVSANNSADGIGLYASSQGGRAVSATSKATGVYAEGSPAAYFQGDVHVTGTLTVDTDIVLTGADCAEAFDVNDEDGVEPGTVMVVGESGALSPSVRSYDKRVAGVVSGAGSYRPGLILDGGSAPLDGRVAVALVGKVFCKVDAQYRSVEVGDLLTTSPTRGHAMAAVDESRAFGTVIGKALRPLSEGQGLIPILVALQ